MPAPARSQRVRLVLRIALLVTAMASLLAGVWGGLVRLPLPLRLPTEHANWLSFHGPLMVCGFLGTLIGLERAVGLGRWWAYLAPVLTGLGGLWVGLGSLGKTAPLLITLGSAGFLLVTMRVVALQAAAHTICLSLGAGAWLAGNSLWLAGWEFPRLVMWWIAFLVLTIVGERLDLTRFQRLPSWAKPSLWVSLGVFLAGASGSTFAPTAGERLAGLGLLAIALWLGRFDIARRTVRDRGLTRYMAVCLLSGYLWLAVGGGLVVASAPLASGPRYDAALHALFLGFVFSMIFGHAPVIFPAVLALPVGYRRRFYGHWVLLHTALAMRVTGDLTGWQAGRNWGAALNAVAIAAFLLNTVASLAVSRKRATQ